MVLPNEEEPKRVESSEAPIDYTESPSEPPPTPPVTRKRRSFFGLLASTLLLLVLIAGAALYAAIAFKDRDERLKIVADYAEPYVDQASGALGELKDRVRSLVGDGEPAQTTAIAPEAPPNDSPASGADAPTRSTAPAKPAETAAERAPLAPSTPAPNAVIESHNAAIESQKAAVAALQSRVDSAEELAQRALRAAEAAETAANAAKTSAEAAAKASPAPAEQGGALTANEQLTALEGRIDELGDEIKALRERVESPKGETRAAPEATAAKTPDGPAAIVVIAYALQRELEAGRPYALETKALTRLGANPAALAALSPLAEKGAPTAAQLKADFAPAAKRIRALESASGDLTEHLMKGASKLVRVRPSGQVPTTEAQTVEEKVAHIEAALAHGDLAQASAVFAALPEAAQNEAKDFGATLRARVDAGRAADDLLHGAIAALGATKE
ncbi:COG4223 family protein [Methylocystis sp.]|uniref:COG4223 family protein n=1 Tax=Methylocystis sp. TaxID=1911079 RepID=UPI003DA44406